MVTVEGHVFWCCLRWRRSRIKHWFSYENIHLIRLKHRLYKKMIKSPNSDVIKTRYKCIRNLVSSKTRKDTEDYVSTLSNGYFDSLKLGAKFIAPSLTKLFQLSLSSGKLPLDWISANVVPVHKKGDKQLLPCLVSPHS